MEYRFSDLFSWTSGKPVTPTEGNIPIYGSNGVIGYSDKAKYCDKIILGRVGAYCGSVAYCSTAFDATDNTLITTCDTTKILYSYAYYLLKQFNLNGYAGGAAQPLITQGLLKHLKCDIPAINQQQRIVDHLSAYDNLIQVNNKRIKVLEQMAENLYKEWFVHFRFPGHESAVFENGMPKDWTIKKIGDIASIKAGGDRPAVYSEYPTEGITVPIYSNGIDNDGLYGFTDKANIMKKSVTISARGTVGFVCLRRTPYVPIVRLIAIVPDERIITPMYLNYYLQRDSVIANGTSQQQITVPMVSRKRILVPPRAIQEKLDELEQPIWSEIDLLREKNKVLIRQRDLLLPRLMSGKLEV